VKVCEELLPAVNVTVVEVKAPCAEPPKVIVTTVVDSTYALGVKVNVVDAVLTVPVSGPVKVYEVAFTFQIAYKVVLLVNGYEAWFA
jgi:hypothetical protein